MLKVYSILLIGILYLTTVNLFAGQVSGVVTDEDDKTISEATVSALGYDLEYGDSLFYTTQSNADGTFLFDDLVEGEYYFRAVASNEWISEIAGPYLVKDTSDIRDIKLVIYDPYEDTGSIAGTVKTYEEVPVVNAYITVKSQSPNASSFTYTDVNGNYNIQRLIPGEYTITAHHPQGFVKEYPELVDVEANEDEIGIDIIFTQHDLLTGSLAGLVRTDTGQPLENVKVYVHCESFSWVYSDSGQMVVTNENGHYRFDELIPGNYRIYSVHPTGGYKLLDQTVEVTGGQESTAPDIVYTVEETLTGYISGIVTIGSETPAVGAWISFYPLSTDSVYYYSIQVSTNGTGHYQASLAPGSYIVICEYYNAEIPYSIQYYDGANNMESATIIEVIADQTTTDINFRIPEPVILPEVEISGVVIDQDGNSLSSVRVEVIFLSQGMVDSIYMPSMVTTTNMEGEYSFLLEDINSSYAQMVVSASHEDYLREFYNDKKEFYLADVLTPTEDQTVFSGINFMLERLPDALNTTIEGEVKNEAGNPIAGVEVTGYHVSGQYFTSSRTESDGTYKLTNLYEGNYIVQFYAPGYLPEYYDDKNNWDEAVQLDAAVSHSNIDAVLTVFDSDSSSNKIAGQVLSDDNEKLGGVYVSLQNESGEVLGFDFSDEQGNYQINNKIDGNLNMSANRVQYYRATKNVRVLNSTPEIIIQNIILKKTDSSTDISDPSQHVALPNKLELKGNKPNPFNPETTIRYALTGKARVSVVIYDILGREVTQLTDEELSAGNHTIKWQGLDKNSVKVNSGVYIYQITAKFKDGSNSSKAGKMILVK